MSTKSQRQKGLNVAIEALNRTKEVPSNTPAKAVFGSTSDLLSDIRDSVVDRKDYVELGLACADVCGALDRGLAYAQADQLKQPVLEAIGQLTRTVAQIQGSVVDPDKRSSISRIFHARSNKETIAAWRSELDRIHHVFDTELALHTHVAVSNVHHEVATTREIVSDIQRIMVKSQEGADITNQTTRLSMLGELPPPPPRACFGRDELIEKVVGRVKSLTPIALIGVGGIGKTSVALTVLHDDRIKKRFDENRRFIRCDQFQPALADFLSRLSKAVGAGIENPEDLTPLRPFLLSKEILIVLDNAESILDPQGSDVKKIYSVVEELSRMSNVGLLITSRITTIPSDCKRLDVPAISMDAARSAFYRIYDKDERPNVIDNILERLDFHPLSVTLLATVAHQNNWDSSRLAREWELQRTNVLRTEHNDSLAAIIELSLASPMFRVLGPNAREFLGAVAFFPQGVDENNLDWLFPSIPNRRNIVDRFCILSLTSRINGFITMLAPLRDHLSPRDPRTSPLLRTTKDCYSSRLRLLGDLEPDQAGYKESQWIRSEDVNVEHLLNVFISFDMDSDDTWDTCADFVNHLHEHKPRFTVLMPKIEGLPDDQGSKHQCLFRLSLLFYSLGNHVEAKRLLTRTLELERLRQGNDDRVARTLQSLADTNRMLNLHEEGIRQAKEALAIYKRLGDEEGQAKCWKHFGRLLVDDDQLDVAEEAGLRAMELFLDQRRELGVCSSHRLLGKISQKKGKREKAIQHYKEAIRIASPFDWYIQLFWIHHALAWLFYNEDEFGNAQSHVDQAKLHAVDDAYCLGRMMYLQAAILYRQGRLEEARAEILCALETLEKLGATDDVGWCRDLLRFFEH